MYSSQFKLRRMALQKPNFAFCCTVFLPDRLALGSLAAVQRTECPSTLSPSSLIPLPNNSKPHCDLLGQRKFPLAFPFSVQMFALPIGSSITSCSTFVGTTIARHLHILFGVITKKKIFLGFFGVTVIINITLERRKAYAGNYQQVIPQAAQS